LICLWSGWYTSSTVGQACATASRQPNNACISGDSSIPRAALQVPFLLPCHPSPTGPPPQRGAVEVRASFGLLGVTAERVLQEKGAAGAISDQSGERGEGAQQAGHSGEAQGPGALAATDLHQQRQYQHKQHQRWRTLSCGAHRRDSSRRRRYASAQTRRTRTTTTSSTRRTKVCCSCCSRDRCCCCSC